MSFGLASLRIIGVLNRLNLLEKVPCMVVRVAWNSVRSSVNSVWVVPREGGKSEVSSAVLLVPVSMCAFLSL
jgi:hypothetical protein